MTWEEIQTDLLLLELYRKDLIKRGALVKNINVEWISGRDRPKLWLVCGKNVGVSSHTHANKVMGKLQDMTSWACIILMRHRNEIKSHKLSQVWASVCVRVSSASRSSTNARSSG